MSKRLIKNTLQLVECLQEKYPTQQWDKMFTTKGRFGQQRRLEQAVKTLFPVGTPLLLLHSKYLLKHTDVIINARKEAEIVNPSTGHYLEIDVYLPELKLALEFQVIQIIVCSHSTLITPLPSISKERHHYLRESSVPRPLDETKGRDSLKKDLATKAGLTLIVVPCWWDKQLGRLVHSPTTLIFTFSPPPHATTTQ
mgnify:CR=1 FL=1